MPVTPVRPPEYRRREPEKEPLYQILAGHLETFLQQAGTAEHRLPLHVGKEMRAYLECGILAYGFVRARCEDCGANRAVAFSCKKRGFCPSCCGRRMADTAARLVDEVLPRVPVRQWVLSLPYEIRYRLAYDGEWVLGGTGGVFCAWWAAGIDVRRGVSGIQTNHGAPDSTHPCSRYHVRQSPPSYATVAHMLTTCYIPWANDAGSEKMADEQHDDLKEEASLSFRANATDLASMLAIGEHITDLTRNIDPDSSVTGTTSRAGIIRYAIRQVGHLVQDAGRTACVDLRGAQGASDVSPCTDRL